MPRSLVRTVVSDMSKRLNPHWRHFQRRVSVYMGAVQGLKSLGLSIRNMRFKSQLHRRTGTAQRTDSSVWSSLFLGWTRSDKVCALLTCRLPSPTLTSLGI